MTDQRKRSQPLGWRPLAALALLLLSAMFIAPAAVAETPAETEQRLKDLEAEVEALRKMLTKSTSDEALAALAEVDRKISILADEIEKLKIGQEAAAPELKSEFGLGPAASKVYKKDRGVSIGGYGEMHYESFDSTRDDGAPSGKNDEIDFLRAIMYFGYKFDDKWVFNSEIEFEHASTGESGSASVEFAYIDYLWRPEAQLRAGLLLIPMGFINEYHEPTTFFGASRPETERRIIPSTWRENGFGLFGDVGGFSYRTYLVNGLKGEEFGSNGLRSGRQKGSNALVEDFAWVGRLDYTARPGLLVGASAYVGDSGQDLVDANGDGIGLGTTILEGHVEFRARGFKFRGLVAQAELDDVVRFNNTLGLTGSSSLGERLTGSYLELGYDIFAKRDDRSSLSLFGRWEQLDTQSKVPAGFARNPARDREFLTLGIHYQPIEELVFKLDYVDEDNGADTGVDKFEALVGYIF